MFNPTSSTQSLTDWGISTNINEISLVFPIGISVPPNSYFVIYFNQTSFSSTSTAIYSTSALPLSPIGGTVFLFSPTTSYLNMFKTPFLDSLFSLGTHVISTGNQINVLLETPTPGAVNSNPLVGPLVQKFGENKIWLTKF